jgi:hypothetical protein
MPRVGEFGLVGRPLARVRNAQEGRDDEHFVQAAQSPRLDQDARKPRVDRQQGHLPAQAGDAAIAIDGTQLLQQAITVVE